MLFRLSSPVLVVFVLVVLVGTTLLGFALGRFLRHRGEELREPFGVVQAALLGFVALMLGFGLTMAVGRYDARRAAVVDESNTIGTTYLRAQTLVEPMRSQSMRLLKSYADTRIALSDTTPGTAAFATVIARSRVIQNELWGLAGTAMNGAPTSSAPRLYMETLNQMIDADSTRVAALLNRVPDFVVFLQISFSALAFGVLGMYVALLGRAVLPPLVGAVMVAVMLIVILDLDRPHRGLIQVPAAPLVAQRASMNAPPAAPAPVGPQP